MGYSVIRAVLFPVTFICLETTSMSAADLISNGSFEIPVVPAGGFNNYTTGSTAITGWTVVGPASSIVSTTYNSFGLSFSAEDGNQWLDLTGFVSNTSEGVEQSAATIADATYNLSYYVGNQVNTGGPCGTTSTVNVLLNGSLIQTSTNSGGTGTGTQNWRQFKTSFVATAASTSIEFLNGDLANDNTNGLDNVTLSVSEVPTSVPEPSTLFLIATAGGFIGFSGLRKARLRTP